MQVFRSSLLASVAVLSILGTGCATKKHVRNVVGPVEARVSNAEKKSAEQASQIGEINNNVSRVDERAMDADKRARAAGESADRANQSAQQAGVRADEARHLAEQSRARLGEVVENIDNYQHVTTESILFDVNKATLKKEAKEQLDGAVAKIKDSKNFVLEIQGFTDSTGRAQSNLALSQRRADAVVRYMTVQHNVPLRKIHVLGVGEEDPTADNTSREGRKQARRVDIKVFALDLNAPAGAKTTAAASSTQD